MNVRMKVIGMEIHLIDFLRFDSNLIVLHYEQTEARENKKKTKNCEENEEREILKETLEINFKSVSKEKP